MKVAVDARYRKAANMDIALKRTNVYVKKTGVERIVTGLWNLLQKRQFYFLVFCNVGYEPQDFFPETPEAFLLLAISEC